MRTSNLRVRLLFQLLWRYCCTVTRSEVYPNSPLAAVVVEVRHPIAEPIGPSEVSAFRKALAELLPIAANEQILDLTMGPQPTAVPISRFVSRDRHQSATFRANGIVVESTEYPGWADFSSLVKQVVTARQRIAPVDGVERVGLRYINEVRVPSAVDNGWGEWIAPELLGPYALASAAGGRLTAQQGIAQFGEQSRVTHTVRWATGTGQAYLSGENLRRRNELQGPFFLIDLDGAWTSSDGAVPELITESAMGFLNDLHDPIDRLFEATITGRLRDEVLRVTP